MRHPNCKTPRFGQRSYRRTKEQRLKLKRQLVDMLGGRCVDCGYSAHLAALDFDHKEPKWKEFTIAEGMNRYPDNKIIMEAHKCELRCSNCHRVKTHPQATDTLPEEKPNGPI